jgi:hypothetical protein
VPWLKGNTHAHTDNSDGDAPLEEVAGWYQARGYDFLFVTDHNVVTDVAAWNRANHPLLLIPGCEMSLFSEGKPVHVNSLGSPVRPKLPRADTIALALQREVDAARAAGGIPQVNHPNYRWAFTDVEMRAVLGSYLLEILNASTECNNFGGDGRPGVEEIWDRLLGAGQRVWAVASDDAHHFRGNCSGHQSLPGGGWVVVRARERSAAAVLDALERGDFYASTEVTLREIESRDGAIALHIAPEHDYRYTTHFIGSGGRVLAAVGGLEPLYRPRGDESYVRAKVLSSNGGAAWTQPRFLPYNAVCTRKGRCEGILI